MNNKFNLFKQYVLHVLSYELDYPFSNPTEVNFQMTNECPLRCEMCNIPDNKKDKDELAVSDMKNVVDQITDWNDDQKYVSFVGGEALVRKEATLEMLKYCKDKDLHTTLVTSGVLLDEELSERIIDTNLDRIAFSVDGFNAETHNQIRGKDVYSKLMENVNYMLETREERDLNLKIDFNTVIMEKNYSELIDIHNKALEMGIDEVFYQAVVPDNTYKDKPNYYDSSVWISEEKIDELRNIVKRLKILKDKHGIVNNSKRYLDLVPEYFDKKDNFDAGKCLAGYMGLNIDPYGDVSICGFGPNLNVKNMPIEKLWRDPEFRRTREKIKNCERPCLMLCYRKARLKDLINRAFD